MNLSSIYVALWTRIADPLHYSLLFTSSCDVPCDVILNSVCQKVIDAVPGESHDITIALMHVDELVYAIASHNHTGQRPPTRYLLQSHPSLNFIFVSVSVSAV